jgi:hypothetical protein
MTLTLPPGSRHDRPAHRFYGSGVQSAAILVLAAIRRLPISRFLFAGTSDSQSSVHGGRLTKPEPEESMLDTVATMAPVVIARALLRHSVWAQGA